MLKNLEWSILMGYAAIFDMDGLLIDSEPFWKEAEKEVFSSVGVQVSEQLTNKTATMTTREATEFWFSLYPWTGKSLDEVEHAVVDKVETLILERGAELAGVTSLLNFLKEKGFKIGLSTNSPYRLVPVILKKLGIHHYFDAISSADDVLKGKPAPDVYLVTLRKLDIDAKKCIAFEDSFSGLIAAKNAKLKTIVVPHAEVYDQSKFDTSDLKLRSLTEFDGKHLKTLLV